MDYLKELKVAAIFTILLILSYNFYIAEKSMYDADGDAADFIGLGASLAAFKKYGRVEMVSGESLITAFRSKQVNEENLIFIGHSTWRPPVWPALIGFIFWVFGFNLTHLLIFKFLLHALGIFIFYKTLKLLLRQPSLITLGTFLYAVSPAWQLYSRAFLSEPVTMFFITAWTYTLIKYLTTSRGFILQGLLGGIIVLSHPYYLFLPFFTWFILWLRNYFNLKQILSFSFIAVCIVSVWIFRNAVVLETDHLVITTSSGAVLAKGWNKDIVKEHTNTQGDLADEELVLLDVDSPKSYQQSEIGAMLRYRDATFHFIRTNPDLILPIIGKKLKSSFNPFPETPRLGILEHMRWMFHFLSLMAILITLFFVKNRVISSLAISLILSTITITILTYSGFRFRVPQIPLELLFIVFAMQDLWLKKKSF